MAYGYYTTYEERKRMEEAYEEAKPIVEFGEYVTHKSPTARRTDTLLGKTIGYLSELLFWADLDGQCRFLDALVPEWFPISVLDDLFISILRGHYNRNYQKQYNRGADQGNKLHNAVFGWIDVAKKDISNRFNKLLGDAKSRLQSQINELDRLTGQFKSQLGSLESAKNKALASIEDLDSRLREVEAKLQAKGLAIPTLKELIGK